MPSIQVPALLACYLDGIEIVQGGGDTAAGAAEWEPHHLKADRSDRSET